MPRSRATVCSSQSPFLSQVWQSPSWSERISSTTLLRASLTRAELVRTFIPSDAGVTQEAMSVFAPSTSTRQTLAGPDGLHVFQVAETRYLHAGLPGRVQQVRSLGDIDLSVVYAQ